MWRPSRRRQTPGNNAVGLSDNGGAPILRHCLSTASDGSCRLRDGLTATLALRGWSMTTFIRTVALAAAITTFAGAASAACFADYRAQKDNPFGLHYGVIEVPDDACDVTAAAPVIAGRISSEGWQLLQVISVFDEGGLDARRSDAGAYFLRF
jgi:hypothetical protein